MLTRAPTVPRCCRVITTSETSNYYPSGAKPNFPRRPFLIGFALCLLGAFSGTVTHTAHGQVGSGGAILARSYSGQFTVCAVRSRTPSTSLFNLETNRNLARLD